MGMNDLTEKKKKEIRKKKALDNTLTKTKQRPKGLALTPTDIRKNMIPPFQADMSFQNSKSIPNCPNNVEIERSLIHYIYRIYMIYIYELKSKNSIFEFSITIIIVRAASRLYFDIYTYVTVISN